MMRGALERGECCLPEVLHAEDSEQGVTLHCQVPIDLPYLEGHFPGVPVVAGVVQLAWAVHFARHRLRLQGGIRRIEQLKFQRLLRPTDRFALELQRTATPARANYRIFLQDCTYSSGRLQFEPPAAGFAP